MFTRRASSTFGERKRMREITNANTSRHRVLGSYRLKSAAERNVQRPTINYDLHESGNSWCWWSVMIKMKTHRKQSKARARTVCWLIRCVRFSLEILFSSLIVFRFLSLSPPIRILVVWLSPVSNIACARSAYHSCNAKSQKSKNHCDADSLLNTFIDELIPNKCMEHEQSARALTLFFFYCFSSLIYRWKLCVDGRRWC